MHFVLSVFGSLLSGGSTHIIAQFDAPLLPCRSNVHSDFACVFKYEGTGGQATSGVFLFFELQLGEQKLPFTCRNAIGVWSPYDVIGICCTLAYNGGEACRRPERGPLMGLHANPATTGGTGQWDGYPSEGPQIKKCRRDNDSCSYVAWWHHAAWCRSLERAFK